MKKFSALLTLALLLPTLVSCKTVSDSDETSSFEGTDTTADTAPLSLFEEVDELRPLETITLDHVYRGEYSRFPDDLKVLPNGHFVCDGNIYVRTQDKAYIGSTDDGRIDRYGWYILSPDGTAKFTLLPPSTPLTDGMNFTAVLHSTPIENGVAVIDQNIRITQTGAHKLSSKTGKLCIASLNADGIVQWAMDPETLTEQRINPVIGRESGYEFQAHFLLCGANGTIYMVTDYSVVAVSPSGEKLYETGEGRAMENAVRTADGRILVQYRQFPENKTYFAYMDDEAKDFGEPFTLPLPQEDGTVVFGEGYDLYYHNVKGLFGMNRDDTQPTLLCNWENSCIHYDSVKAVLVLSADRFFCLVQDPMTEEYEYAILHRVSEEEMQSKKIITLGVVDGNIDFGDYAARFSRQSDEYHVVIRDYVQQRKNGGNTLEEDALAGTLPDIVVSVYVNKQIANLADKGSFVDLNRPLSIDSEFKNDLLPFVLEPFETGGALYWLNSVFTLDTMCGNAALLPEPKEWTTERFFQFIEECEAAGVQAIGKTYREKMTEKLLYNNLSAYINFNKNKVGGQAVLGRQWVLPTPWLTERHGYDPT